MTPIINSSSFSDSASVSGREVASFTIWTVLASLGLMALIAQITSTIIERCQNSNPTHYFQPVQERISHKISKQEAKQLVGEIDKNFIFFSASELINGKPKISDIESEPVDDTQKIMKQSL